MSISKCVVISASKSVPTDGPQTKSRLMWNGTVYKNEVDDRVFDAELGTLRLADKTLTIEHNGNCIKCADDEIDHLFAVLGILIGYLERKDK